MRLRIFTSKDELYDEATRMITELVNDKPKAVLGLATGGTPMGLYKKLIEAYRSGEISFKDVTSFNLDEYVGLPKNHDQSYSAYMQKNLFQHIDIKPERAHIPDSECADANKVCEAYDEKLNANPRVDLQLLGLGHNGHIGFNEPGERLISGTHVVELQESTRSANARYFPSMADVPTHAITMGIGMILRARRILLIVTGEDKAEILQRSFRGPITTKCPASMLQTHPDVHLLCDQEAATLLASERLLELAT